MVEFARLLGATRIRHVVNSAFARQATAALVLDTTDMTADAAPLHARFPDLTWHRAADVVKHTRTR
jgi:hypothetical protein